MHSLDDPPVDDRRKDAILGGVARRSREIRALNRVENVLEPPAAAECAVDAAGNDQAARDQSGVKFRTDRGRFAVIPGQTSSSLNTNSIDALLVAIRSLEIISAADNTSR